MRADLLFLSIAVAIALALGALGYGLTALIDRFMESVRVSLFFATYDAWVGFFWDGKKRILYFCPMPCVVLKFEVLR